MLNWYNSLVPGAVLLILIVSGGRSVMDAEPFDPLSLATSVAMLLILPVLFKLASRRPKDKARRK